VGSSIGIAVLVTVLSGQIGAAAAQAPCDPSPQVLASPVMHRIVGAPSAATLSATQVCGAIRGHAAAGAQNARTQAAPPSTGDPAVDQFLRSFGQEALTIAFDRTFVFTAIVTAIGLIPAMFLRKPPRSVRAGAALAA
jgi:hypothetical protein